MVPGWGWTAEQRDVSGYDASSHRISFAAPIEFSEYYDADQYSLYFLYDKLSLLDAPSEWYLDRASGTVYVWLPDGGDPNGHLVEASGGSGGFDLRNRSYIRVAGFNLMSGDIKMLDATGCRVEEVRHLYPAAELCGERIRQCDHEKRNRVREPHGRKAGRHAQYAQPVPRPPLQLPWADFSSHRQLGNTKLMALRRFAELDRRLFAARCGAGRREHHRRAGYQRLRHRAQRDLQRRPHRQGLGRFLQHERRTAAGRSSGTTSSTTSGRGNRRSSDRSRLGSGIYFDVTSSGFVVHHNLIYRTGGYAIS